MAIRVNCRITIANVTNVAFEVSYIDRIKSDLLPPVKLENVLMMKSRTIVTQSLISASVSLSPTR
jgi:hypothetical protein